MTNEERTEAMNKNFKSKDDSYEKEIVKVLMKHGEFTTPFSNNKYYRINGIDFNDVASDISKIPCPKCKELERETELVHKFYKPLSAKYDELKAEIERLKKQLDERGIIY